MVDAAMRGLEGIGSWFGRRCFLCAVSLVLKAAVRTEMKKRTRVYTYEKIHHCIYVADPLEMLDTTITSLLL